MNITRMSLCLEIDDKLYVAITSDLDLPLIVNMIGCTAPTGKLQLIPAPEDFRFAEFRNNKKEKANENPS
jgi:hypothetical protein